MVKIGSTEPEAVGLHSMSLPRAVTDPRNCQTIGTCEGVRGEKTPWVEILWQEYQQREELLRLFLAGLLPTV